MVILTLPSQMINAHFNTTDINNKVSSITTTKYNNK